jgi:hypothetical protein
MSHEVLPGVDEAIHLADEGNVAKEISKQVGRTHSV